MAIDINIPIENAVTDGSLNPVTSNAVFDSLATKANTSQLAGLVPYTGAIADVNLGTHKLTAKDLVVNHPSGSGDAATITKGGSGEALKVVKSSGSGNAASITGGVTLLSELDLQTPLADAEIASAATWNAKIGGAVSIGQVAFGTGTGVIGGDAGLTWDNTNKRLGIGNSTPTARLHVQAQGALSTDIALRVRNSADTLDIIRAQGDGSVFIGLGAGNVNTGSANTAYGFDALRFNTTGANNTANGVNALRNNTTGGFNTAYGVNALRNNTTGSNNTANGVNAGRFIADGVTDNSITNNSVFYGANTKALANNQTNQIVIGHDAIGLGSNTSVIGNTSTTLFRPYGNVAIGADTAGARLDVRAQGALSTDVAFRVRNSADTADFFKIQGNGSTVVSAPANGFTAGFAVTVGGQNRYSADQYRGYLAGTHYVETLGTSSSSSIAFVSGLGASNNLSVRPNFGSISLGSVSSLGDGGNTIYIKTSTTAGKLPPTASIADGIAFYSNDITAGNASPHFRTENGSVIKLYQQDLPTNPTNAELATFLSNLGLANLI